MLVALGGRLYAVGGFPDGPGFAADVWTYDPVTDAWAAVAQLPAPRAARVSAYLTIGGHRCHLWPAQLL